MKEYENQGKSVDEAIVYTLYVAVSLEEIKKTEVWKQGTTENGVAQNSRSVTYSICDLFEKINPKDIDFIKYLPDELLTEEQFTAKHEYLDKHNSEKPDIRYQPRPQLENLILDELEDEMTTNDARLMTEYFKEGNANIMYYLINQTRNIDIANGIIKNLVSRLIKSYELSNENNQELAVAVLSLLESQDQAETEENMQMLKDVFAKVIDNSTFYSEYAKGYRADVLDFLKDYNQTHAVYLNVCCFQRTVGSFC